MAKHDSKSLAQLVADCRRGDQAAWRDLLERISPLIFSICRDSRLTDEEALDVFGQVSYLLLTNISKIRSGSKILSYVGTITRRQIYDRYYKDRLLDFVDSAVLQDNPTDDHTGPDRQYERRSRRQILHEALASLPSRDYKLLQALFIDDSEPTYEEIARKLNMPVASIGPTRQRALEKLKRKLRQMGFNFDVF